ncbi:Glycosyltransferase, GT2 family, partial [Candidatus Methanophagaceae archaeon]
NVGIENATGDIILFLDSDVVLDKDYIKEIVKVYEMYPDALGVQGYITNIKYSTVMNAINKFFFFNFLEKTKCRILPSGFPTYPYTLKQIVFCQWLSGTNQSYKKSVFKEYRYDENLRKYSLSEDVDMSYRIFKTHFNSLLIVPYATLIHKHSKEGRIPKKQMVYMKQIYPLYFFYKNIDQNVKNKVIFLWSRIGYLLCNFGLFLLKPSKTKWLKWKYIICAYVSCIRHLREIKRGDLDFFNKSLVSDRLFGGRNKKYTLIAEGEMHQNKKDKGLSKIKPFVSVVICTYNRSDHLKKCLDSMQDQTHDNFEVIVVNGPSTDNTEEVLKNYPFKMIQQKEKGGLSAARNLGIEAARGEIIAFIDDDGIADEYWLDELTKLYITDVVVSVGGKIAPLWLCEKPEWYTDYLGSSLSLFDRSQNIEQMTFPHTPYGCNMSFRKRIFEEIGYFDVSLGRCLSKNLLCHDELDLYKRINEKGYKKKGYKTMYNPKAIVYHQIDASRLTKAWFKKRYYWNGISNAVFTKKHYGTSYLFILTLRALFLAIPYNLVRYSFERIKKDNKSFIRVLSLLSKLGYIKESLGLNFGGR